MLKEGLSVLFLWRPLPVSRASVVTEFCDGFSFCSDWDLVEPQSFSFSKKRAHSCTVTRVRKLASDIASAIQKKKDTAHADAKFVFVRMTEQFLRERNSTWKKVKV